MTHPLDQILEEVELGDFDSYMEKEIFEQPAALENTLRGRFGDDGTTAKLGGLEGHEEVFGILIELFSSPAERAPCLHGR